MLLRIPYLLLEIPLLQPELTWMLIGERMSHGYSMYIDIYDTIGPLGAGTSWLLHLLFGKSLLAYRLLAGPVILFQIVYLNQILIQHKAFEENTYVPALVMAVLVHLSFDFLTLSPALIGSTFVLLALGQLFNQTARHQDNLENVLLIGLFGGLAFCFHFALIAFLPFILIAGLALGGFNLRQLILCLIGYLLPFCLCALYYFWIGGLDELLNEFLFPNRHSAVYHHMSYGRIALLFFIPLIFTSIGFVFGALIKRVTVNQQKQNQLMILFLVFSVAGLLIADRKTPYQLVTIVPGIAYFISQIFIYFNNRRFRNLLFYTFLLGVPMAGYGWAYYLMESGETDTYAVPMGNRYEFTAGSSIMVLGDDLGYYRNASLGGPFLNFHLSRRHLEEIKTYGELTALYIQIIHEKPQYIIDEQEIFRSILDRLPELEKVYVQDRPGIYRFQ